MAAATLPYSQASASAKAWRFAEPKATGRHGYSVCIYGGSAGAGSGSAAAKPPKIQLCLDGDAALTLQERDADGKVASLRFSHEGLALALKELDNFALDKAEAKCQAWFKKKLQREQLETMLLPCARPGAAATDSEAPPPPPYWTLDLLCSPDLSVWSLLDTPAGASAGAYVSAKPEDLQPGRRFWACAEVSQLFFQPRSFGVALLLTDALLLPEPRVPTFPFVSAADYAFHEVADGLCDDASSLVEEAAEETPTQRLVTARFVHA